MLFRSVRRKRPNRPSLDNALRTSWRPLKGDQFSRRGLLELDLVLAAFLERHLDRLDAQQMGIFKELLEQPDNDLLHLVMGRAEPVDEAQIHGPK